MEAQRTVEILFDPLLRTEPKIGHLAIMPLSEARKLHGRSE